MGYTTTFEGEFSIDGVMSKEFVKYIERFAHTRRMKRDTEKIMKIFPDWKKLCFDGKLGAEGEFLAVKDDNNWGQTNDDSIIDYNEPPKTQPGLWSQWIIKVEEEVASGVMGNLVWDGGEKFYYYIEWLEYYIKKFFIPQKLEISGVVLAIGEESGDATYIVVDKNIIFTYDAMDESSVEKIQITHMLNSIVCNDIMEVKTDAESLAEYWGEW